MKIISFDKICALESDKKLYYDWIVETLNNKNDIILPPKISMKMDLPGVFYNVMPTILPKYNVAGVKVVTRYPNRAPSLNSEILLYDLLTGNPLALLDGNYITAYRTGAVAAHSVMSFAKKDFKKIGFIGLGNTARATLQILERILPSDKYIINLFKYKEQHNLFAERFQCDKWNFNYYDSYRDVIENSDVVISSVTMFDKDICEDSVYGKGILLVPIHTKGFSNCDLFFDKIFVDDIDHIKNFKNYNKFKQCTEVKDVVLGKHPGRENDDERIIAYNIGIAAHDIFFATRIFQQIGECCEEIDLNAPKDKFWI